MKTSNYKYDFGFLEEEPQDIDDFDKFEQRLKNVEGTLTNPTKEQTRENSLFSAIIYVIRYQKTQNMI